MAIDTQKFLPQSKRTEIAKSKDNFLVPYNKIITKNITRVSSKEEEKENPTEDLKDTEKKLVDIYKLLKSIFTNKKKTEEKKKTSKRRRRV